MINTKYVYVLIGLHIWQFNTCTNVCSNWGNWYFHFLFISFLETLSSSFLRLVNYVLQVVHLTVLWNVVTYSLHLAVSWFLFSNSLYFPFIPSQSLLITIIHSDPYVEVVFFFALKFCLFLLKVFINIMDSQCQSMIITAILWIFSC